MQPDAPAAEARCLVSSGCATLTGFLVLDDAFYPKPHDPSTPFFDVVVKDDDGRQLQIAKGWAVCRDNVMQCATIEFAERFRLPPDAPAADRAAAIRRFDAEVGAHAEQLKFLLYASAEK